MTHAVLLLITLLACTTSAVNGNEPDLIISEIIEVNSRTLHRDFPIGACPPPLKCVSLHGSMRMGFILCFNLAGVMRVVQGAEGKRRRLGLFFIRNAERIGGKDARVTILYSHNLSTVARLNVH